LTGGDVASHARTHGVTWLDQEIAQGASLNARPNIGAGIFEREFASALQARGEYLKRLGLIEENAGQLRPRARFLDELYTQEISMAGRRLAAQYGELVRLEAGQTLTGRVASIEELPSGPHALIAGTNQFSLIPSSTALTSHLGKTLSLSIGSRGLGVPMGPPQHSIRFEVLELKRTRSLGGFK
jgi:Protein of unknown function (DUF3363)